MLRSVLLKRPDPLIPIKPPELPMEEINKQKEQRKAVKGKKAEEISSIQLTEVQQIYLSISSIIDRKTGVHKYNTETGGYIYKQLL